MIKSYFSNILIEKGKSYYYSKKGYEIYKELINKYFGSMETKEYKSVIITAKFDEKLEGQEMIYNPDSGMYEYGEYDEDIRSGRFESNKYQISLTVPMVEIYLKEGLLQIKINEEDIQKEGPIQENYKEHSSGNEVLVNGELRELTDIERSIVQGSYKIPTDFEILRDEIDGLKSTIYYYKHDIEEMEKKFYEKVKELYNNRCKFWFW